MVPFWPHPAEADRVLSVMAEHGLGRGEKGLQLRMCEIPSNVILAEEFARLFDGFSIGSNDLTQLVLGVDRDSAELAGLFDERDAAVKRMIVDVIERAIAPAPRSASAARHRAIIRTSPVSGRDGHRFHLFEPG